ncbi:hypothetical protein EJ08DRAFT_698983 [Tothia fuscella]|uniref:Stc1 domain-containing protein n=1 Tax=Tothia fuscella TaxID=1048955 RepID=A0A9P4NP33_9PEZI|nr:hypothetical protein EJ08DRAFT_698983 [Tothia fuscella]
MVNRSGGRSGKNNRDYNTLTGGYNGMTANQLRNIQLPATIRCMICEKAKSSNGGYSNKQQAEVRAAILAGNCSFKVKCIGCSGVSKNELHCVECGLNRYYNNFAKTHRSTPDEAVCMDCMDERLQLDVGKLAITVDDKSKDAENGQESDDDDSEGTVQYNDTTDYTSSYNDTASTAIDLNSLDRCSTTLTNSSMSDDYGSSSMNTSGRLSSGGVRLSPADDGKGDWQSTTITRARRVAPSSTGANGSAMSVTTTSSRVTIPIPPSRPFDPNAYGNPRAPKSVTSVATSTSAWSSSSYAKPTASTGKFPRVKAYVPKPEEDNTIKEEPKEEEEEENESVVVNPDWESDDEEEPSCDSDDEFTEDDDDDEITEDDDDDDDDDDE